jgi:sulfur dioxygenase
MQGTATHTRIEDAITRDGVIPEVSVDWTAANLKRASILDVREDDEMMGPLGHIDGVAHIRLAEIVRARHAFDRHQPLIVVCRSGGRSGKAAVLLESLGFTRVASMAGGMLDWNTAGLPVVRHPHR